MSEAFAGDEARATGGGASRPILLRAAREAAGLHIAALAAALKVPVRKLEALEAGNYGELPDMTFARALASSACRQLKVDPAPILEQIPQGVVPDLGASRQGINAPFQSAQDPAPINPLSWLSRPALLAAIVLLLGALVIVFLPRMEEAAQAEAGGTSVIVTPVEPVEPAEPVPAQEPPLPAVQILEGQTPTAGAGGGVVTEAPVVADTAPASPLAATPASPETAPPALPAPAAPATNSLLSIAATGETWIEVVNGAGNVVMQRVLQAGDTVDFSSSPPYSVVLGRAEVAQVTVRGKPFDVTPHIRNNVARFGVK
ncbi:helix-turn-helix domain-containing protein [Hydrogenophaga sp.]|uniref:helix-turn-helix domain-containing protein n=1 Tax=Hydrogenophaga sp. TaxID=1904254 RepID=UPI003D13CB92